MAYYTFELTTTQGMETIQGSAVTPERVRLEAVRFLSEVLRDEASAGRVGDVAIVVRHDDENIFKVMCSIEESARHDGPVTSAREASAPLPPSAPSTAQ